MTYTKAQDVRSPKKWVGSVQVLIDQGPCPAVPDGAGRWSLSVVDYDNEPRLAICWNGYDNDKHGSRAGFPNQRGNPVWFYLPYELEDAILARADELIPKDKLAIAKALLGQRNAV